ncbi:MAG: S41 family peptidase [Phycisphaerae bacterium]
MPKRNLLLILAAIVAATAVVMMTRTPSTIYVTNDELARYRGVAEAAHKIRSEWYPIPTPEDKRRNGQAATVPSEEELRREMVRGMIERLDKFSSYIPPSRSDDFSHRVMGKARGVGLEVEWAGDELRVIGAMVNSPAQAAGLVAGDVIASIDGLPVAGKTIHEVRRMLDGRPGTTAVLTILRQGKPEESVPVTRAEFAVESVYGLFRDADGRPAYLISPQDGIAYLRIKEFVPDTLEKVQAALRSVEPLSALVLDLRDNPGGEFKSSLGVSGLFLREGTIVTVFSRNAPPQKFAAEKKAACLDVPVVVLVNGRSASGAEIVAGSLSVNDRAVLVGTRTLGKGCMQRIIKLDDDPGGELNLTTSEYYVGDDTPIAMRGIEPHVVVTITDSLHDVLYRMRLESELAPPPRSTTAPAATEPAAARAERIQILLDMDPQLATAVKLLQTPQDMQDIINGARKARLAAKAAKTQPATTRATTAAPH